MNQNNTPLTAETLTSEEIKSAIEQRIISEYQKYSSDPQMEWAMIAAAKIYASHFQPAPAILSKEQIREEAEKLYPDPIEENFVNYGQRRFEQYSDAKCSVHIKRTAWQAGYIAALTSHKPVNKID